MPELKGIAPERVFTIFEEICSIPHGSQNMEKISDYCVAFAEKNSLRCIKDSACNVVIFKPASKGYKNSAPIILQGHLDMVCQSDGTRDIDFEKDGILPYIDGDFIKARGTTLGADNGIALAMVLSILEDKTLSHPPIEAVFTIDEEIGMIGATALDTSVLSAKRMINIDSEEENTVTVSCAGGGDILKTVKAKRVSLEGRKLSVTLSGLQGGHSGIEINKGRVNASILAGRILNHLNTLEAFELIGISGGEKGNAIPSMCTFDIVSSNADVTVAKLEDYLKTVSSEITDREPDFAWDITIGEDGTHSVLTRDIKESLIYLLSSAPNGVVEMSAAIEGLVETSLNLGILKTGEDEIVLHFTLRSNKLSALDALEERMVTFLSCIEGNTDIFGRYPAWEYMEDSELRRLFIKSYTEAHGTAPKVAAIHAGLECGVFASKIHGLDCISIGPDMLDVHTPNERLSISSAEKTYGLLLEILKNCK